MTKIKKYQTPSDNLTKDSSFWDDLSKTITNVSNIVKDFYNNNILTWQSAPRRIQNKINQYFPSEPQVVINGPGTDIVKLDKDAIRVTPETEQRGTLFNEFVESEENPTVRTAEWYKLNQDQSVGDRNIPVANFTYYGGLENGAFKVQSLDQFNDTTTVIPARNLKRDVVPIKEILNKDSNLISLEEFDKQKKALIKERDKVVDKYIPWYELKNRGTVLSDPYVVPNTRKRLSEKEMENISKRLRLYNDLNFGKTDSLQYYKDNWYNAIPYADADELAKAKQDLEEFEKRLPKYEEDFKKVQKEKLKSIEDFSSELSPEEQMLQQLNFSKPYDPTSFNVNYGGVLRIGDKHKEVPWQVYKLITPSELKRYVTPIDREFLKLYDQRLVDIENTYSNIKKKFNNLKNKLKTNGSKNRIRVVTTKNDTIPISQYNAAVLDKKAILGNPKGSMFIADFGNMSQDQLENVVNPYLRENPSVLFMPDMGAYSLYGLQNGIDPKMLKNTYMDVSQKPTYKQYWNQFTESESKAPYNPNEHYLIGVKKDGGIINYLDMFNNKLK